MMTNEPDAIYWDERGAIVITNPKQLEGVLKKYFKTSQYASFQKQLNNFGFKKKRTRASDTVYVREKGPPLRSLDDILKLQPLHILPPRRSPTPPEAPSYFCQNGYNPWTRETVSFDDDDDERTTPTPRSGSDANLTVSNNGSASSLDSGKFSSSNLRKSPDHQHAIGDVLIYRE